MDDKNWNKICKLKIHERKLHIMCISVDGSRVKMLASKFIVSMKIMMKHCSASTSADKLYSVYQKSDTL